MIYLFFGSPAQWRRWLAAHHDEALCFGWIDGRRWSIDEMSYAIRFTPRRFVGGGSAVNVRRGAKLTKGGRMRPAGLGACAERALDRVPIE